MLKVILVRPGATEFDEQRRIQGSLDLPLTESGVDQVARTAVELAGEPIEHVYTAPCTAGKETAKVLVQNRRIRITELESLRNLDHGLWHGKLIDEVKRQQPRVYRMWQETPQVVCPPEGEPWAKARERVTQALRKICRWHRDGVVALVVSEPIATVVRSLLGQNQPADLWKSDCNCGRWELIDIESTELVLGRS